MEQLMRTDSPQKVLEKLATGDKVTIVIERQTDLKSVLRQGLS
jgi:Cu/Ag efflux protein CusF